MQFALRQTATRGEEILRNALLLRLEAGDLAKPTGGIALKRAEEGTATSLLLLGGKGLGTLLRGHLGAELSKGGTLRVLITRAGRLVARGVVARGVVTRRALPVELIYGVTELLIVGRERRIGLVVGVPHLTTETALIVAIQRRVILPHPHP